MYKNQFSNDIQDELSSGFLRQRRNLILVSLGLPVFVFGEARLEKLNIFGSTIEVVEPSAIYYVVIAIFGYFFFRYWQYYGNEKGAKEYKGRLNKYLYQSEFNYFAELMKPHASVFDYEHYYPEFSSIEESDYQNKYRPPTIQNDEKLGVCQRGRLMQINGVGRKYDQHYMGENYGCEELSEEKIEEIESQWRLKEKAQHESRAGAVFETTVTYNTLKIRLLRLKSYISFSINRPEFTDYRFPLILSALSFVSSVIKLVLIEVV